MSFVHGVNWTGYLDDSYSDFNVNCAWPISGQYCLLNRILFYVLLVFAVLMRRSPWLVAGALASALSYSGTAAIHALMRAFSKSPHGTSRNALQAIEFMVLNHPHQHKFLLHMTSIRYR